MLWAPQCFLKRLSASIGHTQAGNTYSIWIYDAFFM